MFLHLETKWPFSPKSAVLECKNFPNAYLSNSILRFSAGIQLSRAADGGKRTGFTFLLVKKRKGFFLLLKQRRAHFLTFQKKIEVGAAPFEKHKHERY